MCLKERLDSLQPDSQFIYTNAYYPLYIHNRVSTNNVVFVSLLTFGFWFFRIRQFTQQPNIIGFVPALLRVSCIFRFCGKPTNTNYNLNIYILHSVFMFEPSCLKVVFTSRVFRNQKSMKVIIHGRSSKKMWDWVYLNVDYVDLFYSKYYFQCRKASYEKLSWWH